MKVIVQSGTGISETHEELKQKQQAEENEAKIKLEEKRYSLEFSNSKKNDIEEKLGQIDDNLITAKEKKEIISKMEAIYINTQAKGLSYNTDEQLAKVIKNSSFEVDGNPNDYSGYTEYNKKIKEIRKEMISQINTEDEVNDYTENLGKTEKNNDEEEITTDTRIKNAEESLESKNIVEYPILKGLHKNDQIDSETYLNILEKIEATPNEKLSNIIDNIQIENLESKEQLDRIFKESNPQKNLENFNKTIKEIDGIDEILDVVNNKSTDTIYEEIHNLIGTSFIQIEHDGENSGKDIKIAIETAGNKVIEKYPSIKKMSNTQAYKNAFVDIKSGNIKAGVEGIKNLLLLGSTIAFAGRKLDKEHIQKAKGLIQSKYKERIKTIEEQIQKLNEETVENKAKQKENTEKIDNLQKEKTEITSGELFKEAGKIDKNSEKKEK